MNGDECDAIKMPRQNFLKLSKEEVIELALKNQKVIETLNGIKIKSVWCKFWPKYDSEVNIIYIPLGKQVKKQKKSKKIKAVSL